MPRLESSEPFVRVAVAGFTRSTWLAIALASTSPLLARAQLTPGDPPASPAEYRARREAMLARLPDGILILTSAGEVKSWTAAGLRQEASFYYFTGLGSQLRGILVLDGPKRESRLYVPWPVHLEEEWKSIAIEPGPTASARLQLEEVAPWEALTPYLEARLAAQPGGTVYLDGSDQLPFATPPGLSPLFGRIAPLRYALERRWPSVKVQSAAPAIAELRAVKRPPEIEATRRAGRAGSAAVLAALRALAPGRPQRQAEAAAVAACFNSGAEDVAWWPWVMTGPNAVFPETFTSFVDYRHLNRRMAAGELARIDVGCVVDHYHSDIGRTAPVSGSWTAEQRETWNLLITAYHAGLRVVRDGVRPQEVLAAFQSEVRTQQPSLRTELARRAASLLLTEDGTRHWQIHSVGLEPTEGPFPIDLLRAGMVVAYEPMFTVDGQGYYLEDLLLIKRDGYELLTPGVPYTAEEIERAMRPPGSARNRR